MSKYQPLKADLSSLWNTQGEMPIPLLVTTIIHSACAHNASDIHIEPLACSIRIRFRIDGFLHPVQKIPKALHLSLISHLKIMTGSMNIAEKRLPQDGRIQLHYRHKLIQLRLSTIPTIHGESAALRILDRSNLSLHLSELGLMPDDQSTLKSLIALPNGLILVTGPTGTGKTTTLYTILHTINTPDYKIITVEDPIEYQLPGINQVQVNLQVGMTFPIVLRSMLRQAPNVIMVGEIRDAETAHIAINASLTGHLVLSTLHTNDAPSAVTRLIDLGIEPYLIASALRAVIAQRLARKLQSDCTPRKRYKGRVGIFEILTVGAQIREAIITNMPPHHLRTIAQQNGMRNLHEDGMRKIAAGLTTQEEIFANCGSPRVEASGRSKQGL